MESLRAKLEEGPMIRKVWHRFYRLIGFRVEYLSKALLLGRPSWNPPRCRS